MGQNQMCFWVTALLGVRCYRTGAHAAAVPGVCLGGLHGVFQWWGVCSWMLLAFPHHTRAFPSFYKETDEGQKPPCTCALQVSPSSPYSAGTAACQTCLVCGQLVVCGFWVRLGVASSTAGKAVLKLVEPRFGWTRG